MNAFIYIALAASLKTPRSPTLSVLGPSPGDGLDTGNVSGGHVLWLLHQGRIPNIPPSTERPLASGSKGKKKRKKKIRL